VHPTRPKSSLQLWQQTWRVVDVGRLQSDFNIDRQNPPWTLFKTVSNNHFVRLCLSVCPSFILLFCLGCIKRGTDKTPYDKPSSCDKIPFIHSAENVVKEKKTRINNSRCILMAIFNSSKVVATENKKAVLSQR